MTNQLTIDRARTAIIIMDYQNDILGAYPEGVRKELTTKAKAVLEKARQMGIPVIYVVVCFRAGYPEISPRNKAFRSIKEAPRLQEGTSGAEILSDVAPEAGDVVVTKRRVGALSSTDLATVLRAKDIETLVLMGVSTSGCVLSTIRRAADMDYGLVVIADCCTDRDEEVHRVLMEKVFPRQATVLTSQELLQALGTT